MMSRCIAIWIVCLLVSPLSAQSPEPESPPAGDAAQSRPAQEQAPPNDSEARPPEDDPVRRAGQDADQSEDRAERLAEYLSDVKFVGRFTVDGQPEAAPKEESYTITRCEKLPAENMYRLTARIKYGEVDNEVPLDLKILWAGNTPVITLDAFWIPGMGTFSARVLMHRDRYSGTWQHGEHGGHLFGRIVPNAASTED